MFCVSGMPHTKGSWKPVHRRGRVVLIPDNDGEEAWATSVGWAARAALRRPPTPDKLARFGVDLEFTLLPPPSRRRTNRRDADKLARSVLDALTGILWADDEQVDVLRARKWTVGQPGAMSGPGLVASVAVL